MKLPGSLRDQLRLYERAGFTLKSIERRTRHYRLEFHELHEPQYLSHNSKDSRGWMNNISNWRRLQSKENV